MSTSSRGNAPPITVERSVTDDTVEYLPTDDTVRYISGYKSTLATETDSDETEREPIYKTVPFNHWATVRSANVARERVEALLDERFNEENTMRVTMQARDASRWIEVVLGSTFNRAGRVVWEPTVSLVAVREITPSSITVSLIFKDRHWNTAMPVTVRELDVQEH